MLSLISSRVAVRVAPRAFATAGASRSMVVGGSFGQKEKAEEERYIRAREAQLSKAKAAAAEAEAAAKALEDTAAVAAKNAAMNEVADLLAKSGDVISEEGLANLVDWKH
mmetsp:Transcript_24338/g.57852  ORF Transcript_24338/g.57852 Transcript_24338/m.57852 type:complete len:110 (+) Transcript_24338:81-410(+)